MAGTNILNDKLSILLKNRDYAKALEEVNKWEQEKELNPKNVSGDLLLQISKTYYFNKKYENSRKYLTFFESRFSDRCLDLGYIYQKYKILILEDKAEQAIEIIRDCLNKKRTEDEKYWLFFYLGKAHFWNGDYFEAGRYLRKCHSYYLESADHHMLGLSLYMLGYLALQRNMFDQSRSFFENALLSFESEDDIHQIGHSYKMLSIIDYRTGNYNDSKNNLGSAKKHYSECGSRSNILHCCIADARISMFQGDYDRSEKILRETYSETKNLNYIRAQALSAEFLGEVCYRRKEYQKAEIWLTDALKLAKLTAPRGDVAAEVYRRLGDVQIELGKLDEAEATLAKAEKLCKHLGDKYELGSVYRAMGLLALRREDQETARTWIDEAVIIHRTINERFELASTYMAAAGEYLQFINDRKITSTVKDNLLKEAGSFAVEAIHLFSEIGLEKRSLSCRILLDEIELVSGRAVKRRAEKELKFRENWLHAGIFVARSVKMMEAIEELKRYSDKNIPILFTGETGTGKEMAARYIHRISDRAALPFVAVNCASIPSDVFESEFFGHRRGAFTGAVRDRTGLIEEADGGVLFLDEITELSERNQSKLLRVLDDGMVRRVGGNSEVEVDVRILSASNRDVRSMVEEGEFREDLYYRLAGKAIHLKPLRQRKEDILALLSFYLNGSAFRIELEAINLLERYPWPGNVRELVNMSAGIDVVERSGVVRLEDLPGKILNERYGETCKLTAGTKELFKKAGPERKKKLLLTALESSSGNKAEAARELGISRNTLYRYLKRYGI
ncbi:MAG: tetratricopeptide repeat protein [Candidatus Latescibacteria bacterium]|nr:tetratricopeptide repeat protein [Candidatus Latescibacterota bacterium]